MTADSGNQSFWEHLDVLRGTLFRIAVVTVVFAVAAFLFKEVLFEVVLAPNNPDFVTYRLIARFDPTAEPFAVQLINTGLADQFMIHMRTAFSVGLLCALPYGLYQLFRFVSPALYDAERKYVVRVVTASYVMFMTGVAVSYFLIFPLTFRFLASYQVSTQIPNTITLQSYITSLSMMSVAMGAVFEIPILAWLLAKLGLLSSEFMSRYRRHAVVVILVLAAVITPTADVFTLLMVSLPMWLLYEAAISIVRRTTSINNSI